MIATIVLAAVLTPQSLRTSAHEYYEWEKREFPVQTSDRGFHAYDDRLTDYSPGAVAKRAAYVRDLLESVRATDVASWSKDDQIDAILFRAQLEGPDFADRVRNLTATDPLIYTGEASDAIFSLIKKEYDTPRNRARSATRRLEQIPAMLEQSKSNLTQPVRLYAQWAIESARSIDPLYNDSLMTALDRGLTPAEHAALVKARDNAITAMHAYADWLEKQLPQMAEWKPLGKDNYEYMLHRILLLPFSAHDVAHLGAVELARYRALEAMLPDPSLADPNPQRAASIPKDQQAFLQAYQSREEEMIRFLKEKRIVTIPDYIGPFLIRQLPEAFKPTSPGGFMNPPGVYDPDNSGFYFIPTYNPQSGNFYIRAAIEDPRPLLGHEGIPGHFLQISIANHLADEIRRHHEDTVFIEGWALYGEEMLVREGLYPPDSAGAAQVLRLARYRAARIGVDVNLHTGVWSFDQAVKYFMDGGGLDREAATGEAAGAAADPTQKISYMVGKWQIMRLLGRYRDAKGSAFRLGQFHDELIANGSLPLSVVQWILLNDPSDLETATGLRLH
ncbi:MAG TPA: DUF885 domain-containing protein [Thermoanaerobaculia bacterium]|nr:DUF885 domain-containing protein [Thermoanaerobaculia bacterium]